MASNVNKPNKNDSFKIDGTIHSKPVSDYVENRVEYGKRKPRLLIAILSVITLLSFGWGAIVQYRLIKQSKQISEVETLRDNLLQTSTKLENQKVMNDSLANMLLKLQKDNELLSENHNPPSGIFFEVQLGSFSSFDLDTYLQNLAFLRQEKHDSKTKLLLGRFRSFKKAMMFENDLKQMGIDNAFLVGRIDHKIVTFQEAQNALEQSNK